MMTRQRIHQRGFKRLPITLLIISTCSLAETSASVEDIAPVSTLPTSIATTSSFIENNTAIRQELAYIVTSEAYATAKEVTHWQPIEKNDEDNEVDLGWLEKLLKYLLGNNADSQSLLTFSMLLKALFIGALIWFVIWVMRRAGYLSGWVSRIKNNTGRKSTVHRDSTDYQQHGWGQLPAHEQIPTVVEQCLAEGKITQAASIFYRGSLRWLVQTQQLSIAIATTENQCLAQIQRLAQFNNSKPHAYISQIISLWVKIAYDKQQRVQNHEQLIRQLQGNADNWLQQLPLLSNSNIHLNNSHSPTGRADNSQQGVG